MGYFFYKPHIINSPYLAVFLYTSSRFMKGFNYHKLVAVRAQLKTRTHTITAPQDLIRYLIIAHSPAIHLLIE